MQHDLYGEQPSGEQPSGAVFFRPQEVVVMSPQEVARKRAYGHYAAASGRPDPVPPRADARVAQSAYWQTLAGGAGTAQPGPPELMPAARSACSAAAQFEPSHQQVPSGAQYPDRWARG